MTVKNKQYVWTIAICQVQEMSGCSCISLCKWNTNRNSNRNKTRLFTDSMEDRQLKQRSGATD